MAYQLQDIIHCSTTNGLTPALQTWDFQEEVAKFIDVTTCIDCKACQVACSEWNDIRDTTGSSIGMYDNPNDLNAKPWTVMRFSEVEQNNKLKRLTRKDGCMYCSDPSCLKAYPAEGAIIQYVNGIVDFQSEQCIGCGYCIVDCLFDIPHSSLENNYVYKRMLCVDCAVVGQESACVETRPMGAIHFGTEESMKTLASERVTELKTRGYDDANLYDPTGVDGTHVVYVLCHTDKPSLYHGSPKNPEISETVKLWKGTQKPLAVVDFAVIPAISIFRCVGVGPNRADGEENSLYEKKDEERKQNDVTPSCTTSHRNVSTTGSPPLASPRRW